MQCICSEIVQSLRNRVIQLPGDMLANGFYKWGSVPGKDIQRASIGRKKRSLRQLGVYEGCIFADDLMGWYIGRNGNDENFSL